MSEEQPSLIPPEEKLNIPAGTPVKDQSWVVVARNPRVNKDWEKLIKQSPENARRCYERLCENPMQRSPGRIFPLKGKQYRGAWEYELTVVTGFFMCLTQKLGKSLFTMQALIPKKHQHHLRLAGKSPITPELTHEPKKSSSAKPSITVARGSFSWLS